MNKIECIIIEDEKAAQDIVLSFLSRIEWISVAGTFCDGIAAIEFLKAHEPDLIFLDIQIPGLSGIEFLKVIEKKYQIIITSAYSHYALEAFELDVRDYLMKPFSFERFLKAINKVSPKPTSSQIHQLTSTQNASQEFAFFNVNKKMVKVQFDDVLFVESMREYVAISTIGNKVITKMAITEIENILPRGFVRIHRSFIVNLSKITAYTAEEIFIDKIELPIGGNYKGAVYTILPR